MQEEVDAYAHPRFLKVPDKESHLSDINEVNAIYSIEEILTTENFKRAKNIDHIGIVFKPLSIT